MMENLKIRDLRTIALLARFPSLRAIARHLDMEPQNLSKRFEQIESSLGKTLFVRSPKGISLTSEGRSTLTLVDKVLSNLSEIQNQQDFSAPYKNFLNISSRGFIISYLCSFLAKEFRESDVGLRFVDQSPEALEASARENLINVVYHFDEVDLGKNWMHSKVGEIPYVFVVRADHPLSGTVSIEEFNQYRMVGGCYIENNKFVISNMMKITDKSMPRGFDSENAIYSKQIALVTYQVAYLPIVSVLPELNNGTIKVINIKGVKKKSRNVYMEVHKDNVLAKTSDHLKKISKLAFSQLSSINID